MDEGPDPECHGSGGDVDFLGGAVHIVGSCYRIDIGSEGEEEDNNVGELTVSVKSQ